MGLFDDKAKLDAIFNRPPKYPACVVDLNEGEVQAIFNRCLATEDSKETTGSCLYYRALGYEKEDTGISFEKAQIAANHKNILYLFGQLRSVHTKESVLNTKMFSENYQGGV